MEKFFRAAISNIQKYGDTDIFPFPVENRILSDEADNVVKRLTEAHANFNDYFSSSSPEDIRSMVPVHHTGFRWGAQLDPFWNAYFLGCVLSIAEKIETTRIDENFVYSYRINKDTYLEGKIFRTDVSWRHFIERTIKKTKEYEYVVICDIADCYSRISHHKLENSLKFINADHAVQKSILQYLGFLTEKRSSGLPIGGPAARILAELSINNIDQYLHGRSIDFVRYADDYHLFATNKKEAYEFLFSISEFLDNEGLGLQRAKTRIVSAAEYERISSSILGNEEADKSPIQKLMSLNLRYDPYAPNAVEKYAELKGKLAEIDIVGLLNDQLAQSKIHIASARRIVSALSAVDKEAQYGAIISILDNMDSLFPIGANVFIAIADVFGNLSVEQQDEVCERLTTIYDSGHEISGIEAFVAYIVRIIGKRKNIKNQRWLTRCYDRQTSPLVRRDIIIVFANWENVQWLSMYRRRFEAAGAWERRAFILASYSMSDEGSHWRQGAKNRFDHFEKIVTEWRSKRVQQHPVIDL
ncbi:RNA-directed DNA polymerase [Ensifer sesbaniae]|uniref:RNA-directed DNA polymerase n=1 Tax=Ensifer sesbaniae TaxID=1214071 RepID=UPI002001D7DD|nr:RNA-directed DNA polymerase [Ensifer sesbaniae]